MNKKSIVIVTTLVLLGVLFRTVFHLAPNVEFLTTAALLSAYFLSKKWAVIVPFLTVVASDIFLGNTRIFLFTWSGFIGVGLFAILIRHWKKRLNATGGSVFVMASAIWFYLWTNFGVWLLDGFHMYEKNLQGLIASYVAGLPFLRLNMAGSFFFTLLSIGIIHAYKKKLSQLYQQINRIKIVSF